MVSGLALLLILVGLRLSNKSTQDREKSSPFECGFTPKSSARLPFSIRFFMLSIIFLVFDVELILIFPAIPTLIIAQTIFRFFLIFLVILILILGLFHEAAQGSLSWAE
jgi:NADH-ubiquinone oxidoreductase chain 3